MSFSTVMNPHMKNSVVMIANGPRYVWPPAGAVEAEAAFGSTEPLMLAIGCSFDREGFAIAGRDRRFVEERRTDDVIRVAGAHRIKTERAEDVPRRGLAVVFVAAITVGRRRVEFAHRPADA